MKKDESNKINRNFKSDCKLNYPLVSTKNNNHLVLSKAAPSKKPSISSNHLLINFIADKKKMKLTSCFDHYGSKNFLYSKDLALKELRLSDEIIEKKPKSFKSIKNDSNNTNSITYNNTNQYTNDTTNADCSYKNDTGKNKVKAGGSLNEENRNEENEIKNFVKRVKTPKRRKSALSQINMESYLNSESENKDKEDRESPKRYSKSPRKRKSTFFYGKKFEPKEEVIFSINMIGNTKTAETKEYLTKLKKMKLEEDNKEEIEKENKKDKDEQKMTKSKFSKFNQKNMISIINQKEESDVFNSSLMDMIKDLKGK